jgi:hypothetical protein
MKEGDSTKSGWIWAGLAVLLFIGLIKFLKPEKAPPPVPKENYSQTVAPVTSLASPTPVEKKIAAQEHRLEVFSPSPLWLRVKTEKKTFEGFIAEGSTWTWKGEGTFLIKLGYTKQVILKFDNSVVPLQENQKTVSLPHEN